MTEDEEFEALEQRLNMKDKDMKFISTIQNHRGDCYDLYGGCGVNLVPHGANAPTTGYMDVPYIFKIKGFAVPDPDLEFWVYALVTRREQARQWPDAPF